jgi:4-amino-4-deoxy-L-arabinose transferase-like glycosyltransferase
MLTVLALVLLFIVASRALEPHGYPAGDPRNGSAFWLIVGGAFMALVVLALAVAIRSVLGERRK